jgi:hypothetical protein
VFRLFTDRRQFKHPGGQQSAGAQALLEQLELAFQLAKGIIQTFNEVVAGHSTHLSYNILFDFNIRRPKHLRKWGQAALKLGN